MSQARNAKKKNIITVLNQARAGELLAISQYMNQHYAIDGMDYGDLAKNMKLIAIDEMRHAEMFAERIKELGGEPVSDKTGSVKIGQTVKLIYPFNADLEDHTIESYNQAVKVCQENGDIITAKLFEEIIIEEQMHMNYFENIGSHIDTLGDVYLSKIAGTSASTGGTQKSFALGLPTTTNG